MSFEDYANHISQKLKLAISMAIIRSVPENLTTDEYINQLKSNILDKKHTDSDISVCSDDFELEDCNSDHNPINNNNICENNNNSDNNQIDNTILSNNFNDILINISKSDNINSDFDNNYIKDSKIDNIILINDRKDVTATNNEDNNTNFEINDRENDYIDTNGEKNDIFTTGDNKSLNNDDYGNLIDEVLQLDESQTILNDFCVNDMENTDNINNNRDMNIKYSEEMLHQDISNATKTLDFNDETYYQSIKDTSTEKSTETYQEPPYSDTKKITADSCSIIDDTNTKKSNLKQDINIEDGPSPKRRKHEDPNSRIKNNISKFLDKNNIASKDKVITENVKMKDCFEIVTKKLDQNNTECTQTNTYYSQSQPLLVIDQKYIYEKSKSIPGIEKSLNLETEIIKKDICKTTNDTKASNINITNINRNLTDKNPIAKDTTQKIEIEAQNYKTNTMKIIEHDTAFQFEREIYLFSQTLVCDERNDDIMNDNRNNSYIIPTTNEDNFNNNKEETEATQNINKAIKEIQTTVDLTQGLSLLSKQNNNNGNRNRDNNSNIFNNNDETQSSTNFIGVQFSPLYQNNNRNADNSNRNNNNEQSQSTVDFFGQQFRQNNNRNRDNNNRNDNNVTTQSTIDLFSQELQQNNNNRNRNNNNRNDNNETTQSTINLFSQELQQNNNNRNIDNYNIYNNNEPTQSTANLFSQQNNNNRNRNIYDSNTNNNNETTQSTANLFSQQNNNNRNQDNNRNNNNNETTLTQNTFENDEINNQSRNSDTDLTDSDEAQTEEVIPFKIVEELNKVKVYLNKIERGTDSSSDTGYRSDSQSRHSMRISQSNVWLNQSGHCLFNYITSCQLLSNTEDITRDISLVLAQLIEKLYEGETYLSFMEEILDTVDSLLHLVLDDDSENEFLKKDETIQRILLLNKSTHIQKYTIEKITNILENIHTNITTKDTLYETENIQKIENSCYIFHILHIILQRYYSNKEKLTKSQHNSQKSQYNSQKSQHYSQKVQYDSQKSQYNSQKVRYDSQKSQSNSQKSQLDGQKGQFDSQKTKFDSQKSQFSSLNSQEVLKKTDISDIWRKKWNPNFKEEKNEENFEKKCPLTDCSKVLNKLIVSCMDGYSLIAYFALKCFNLMQS